MGLAWLYYILCKTLHSKHTRKGVMNFEGMYVCMTEAEGLKTISYVLYCDETYVVW